MSGHLVVDYITTKSTVSVSWGVLNNDEFQILKKHIDDKCESNGFYSLVFTEPQNKNETKMTAYTEELNYYPYFMSDGSVIWRDVSIEFSEV